jgi:hypothetical protein
MQAANFVCVCVNGTESNLLSLYTSSVKSGQAASYKKLYNDACRLVAAMICLCACSGARPPVYSVTMKSVRLTEKVFGHKICDLLIPTTLV